MARHNELGKLGEEKAVEFLLSIGHSILSRNYRYARAEIDIISKSNEMLVFTEVKTRSTEYFGLPEESIDRKKRKLLMKAAGEFLVQNKIDLAVRFDVISILNNNGKLEVRHIPNAFVDSAGETGAED